MTSRKKIATGVLTAFAVAGALSACSVSTKHVATGADEYVCVYNTRDGGFRLTNQLPPNTGRTSVGNGDHTQTVTIPASFRFYNIEDDTSRDPKAPAGITDAFAQGTAMKIELQLRFRFNLSQACDWYAKHGRRDADASGDLGFNARGVNDSNAPGWFSYLSENFAPAADNALKQVLPQYDWKALSLNYPVNADKNTGLVPDGQTPGETTQNALSDALAPVVTTELQKLVSGPYFCGTDSTTDCGNIGVIVKAATPNDPSLLKSVQTLAQTQAQIQTTIAQTQLQKQTEQAQIDGNKAQAEVLQSQLSIAQLQAQVSFAPCAQYAAHGLDCQGNFPQVVVQGNGYAVTGSAPKPQASANP